MSLPQKAVDHPNCPCGCQGEMGCRDAQEKPAAKAGCCSPVVSCCASKKKPDKPACCQQNSQDESTPAWQALCRCGEKIGKFVVIALKYRDGSAAGLTSQPDYDNAILLSAISYESRSEAPCPPPPRNRLLIAIS